MRVTKHTRKLDLLQEQRIAMIQGLSIFADIPTINLLPRIRKLLKLEIRIQREIYKQSEYRKPE
ncbi:MAG: hypothetical protein WC389_14935 [Lutibacter sp.]|jgi:hypothetical protein